LNAIKLSDYNYLLPEDRIATHPLLERDAAKMLVYNQIGNITHSSFKILPDYLPENTLMVLNDTKVVHARLLFQRDSGAQIEVFCLHPIVPFHEMNLAMQVQSSTTWECMAGNQKRWKIGETGTLIIAGLAIVKHFVEAHKQKILVTSREVIVEFAWEPANQTWAKILEMAGKMPLPPYIHREADLQDETEYQTVFAKQEGAVAAPTAGLHFTEILLEKLRTKGIKTETVTLHVGAGTFQPVEHENVLEHPMHREQMVFERPLIEKLSSDNYYVIAAGTTSLRALESLYWFGNQLQNQPDPSHFWVGKLQPYEKEETVSLEQSMNNILKWMDDNMLGTLNGETEIFIFPGYEFKVCKGLITNFHLPQSTLLMLVSAIIGDDWKKIYELALEKDYRFLSYGDGMLLLR